MTAENFIRSIRLVVEEIEINSVIKQLQNPAGRNPKQDIENRSAWYNALSYEDRDNLYAVVKDSVQATIFGFLCSLDGVRKVSENGKLELREIFPETGESNILSDGNFGDLHDAYLSMIENEG